MEVEERVEDGHGGRLEQEHKLDPDLVMIMDIILMMILGMKNHDDLRMTMLRWIGSVIGVD